jgi:transposase
VRQPGYGSERARVWKDENRERAYELDRDSRIRNDPKRKQEDAERRANAANARKEWTDHEMEIALRTDITADEAAKMIGRSRKAIYAMRDKLRNGS